MLSMRQLAWPEAGVLQQRPQVLQSVRADEWLSGHVHESARPGVKHPQRDIDASGTVLRGQTTADNGQGMTDPYVVDPDLSAEPRVPAIANYSRLGTMGVPLLVCTTPSGHILHWTRRPRTSSTSRRCRRSNRQLER